jgi:Flp pilus assembly protein TadG
MVALDRMQAPMTARALRKFNNRGQALVEFALLLPLVMLILIGVVEFGRAWQAKQTLTDVAREAARMSVISDPTVTQGRVDSLVRVMISRAGFDSTTVTVEWPDGCKMPGCSPLLQTNFVTSVRLTMPHQFVALHQLISLVTSGGVLTLSSTARMRIE